MFTEEFAQELILRRERVLSQLGDDVLVLFSAPVFPRNGDVEHLYRQHSDFFYLTGFEEPDAALVLKNDGVQFTLFVRPRDPTREVWDGRRAGTLGAKEVYRADESHPIEEFDARLTDLLVGSRQIHCLLGENEAWDRRLVSAFCAVRARRRRRVIVPAALVSAEELLFPLRRLKSDFERTQLAAACALTAEAHLHAMAVCQPGMREWALSAAVEGVFRKGGARREAYGSIVGGGPNATILHYRDNDAELCSGDLVLIDAGAELSYYAADITRTFPVNGTFTPAQREIYQLTLDAQKAALAVCVPGKTMDDVHEAAFDVIQSGLTRLGIVDAAAADPKKEVQRYFMHRTSHYLGMDVHDASPSGLDGQPLAMEPGVVITVEPGIYIAVDDETVAERYRGIGVRIEDDVVITSGAPLVLTGGVPKEIDEVESACRRSPKAP